MIDKLGGRKFMFGMVLLVMNFILVLMDKLTPDAFMVSGAVIGGTYVIGNVLGHVTDKM
jgi:hypothetical protein